jgi:hypothetical protein
MGNFFNVPCKIKMGDPVNRIIMTVQAIFCLWDKSLGNKGSLMACFACNSLFFPIGSSKK